MRVDGQHTIADVPRERVFDALTDPAILARSLPGCRELVQHNEGNYELVMEAGAGAVRGTYRGAVAIDRQQRPELYEASLRASGSPGSIEAQLHASLQAEGAEPGTRIEYRIEAQLSGPIAGVGQRAISGVSRRNATAFFDALETELMDAGTGPEKPAAAGEEAVVPSEREQPAPPAEQAAEFQTFPGRARRSEPELQIRWFVRGLTAGVAITLVAVIVARIFN